MKHALSALAFAAAMIASPAFAQDEETFDGAYVGAYVGYDSVSISDATGSGSQGGVAFGGLLGYNFDLGGSVIGVEGEIGEASTHQTEGDIFLLGDKLSLAANLDVFLSARVGVKASPSTLIYAKGGYASTRMKLSYSDGAGTSASESDSLDGFRIGAGIEHKISSLSLRAEYRYSDYGEYSYQGVKTGLTAKRHQVVVAAVSTF